MVLFRIQSLAGDIIRVVIFWALVSPFQSCKESQPVAAALLLTDHSYLVHNTKSDVCMVLDWIIF